MCRIRLSPTTMTLWNRDRMSQISAGENHRMSQSRGMNGASSPMRPPEESAARRAGRDVQRGAKGVCKDSEEIGHVER